MIVVYGKKNGCAKCHNAKKLMEFYGIEFFEEFVDVDKDAHDFIVKEGHDSDFPQFFSGADYVGNFDDLIQNIIIPQEEIIKATKIEN